MQHDNVGDWPVPCRYPIPHVVHMCDLTRAYQCHILIFFSVQVAVLRICHHLHPFATLTSEHHNCLAMVAMGFQDTDPGTSRQVEWSHPNVYNCSEGGIVAL